MAEQCESDEQAARRGERPPGPDQVDAERSEQRAEGDRSDHDELEQAEHPTDDSIVGVLLHAREPGHVEQAVREARERKAHDRDDRVRPESDQRQRQAPAGERELERAAEPTATDEPDAGHRPDEPAHAEGGSQDPDTRFAEAEEIDRDHHEQNAENAADKCLRSEQAYDEPDRPVARDRCDALAKLPGDRARGDADALDPCGSHAADQDERACRQHGAGAEDGSGPPHGEQDRCKDRPAEDCG